MMNVLTDQKPIDKALMETAIQKLEIREQNPTDAQIGHAYRLEQAQQIIDRCKAHEAAEEIRRKLDPTAHLVRYYEKEKK